MLSYFFVDQLHLVHWWSKTEVEILVDPNDLKNHMGKEHSILILNHKYEIDILIITVICNYFGMEGNLRGFAKKSLQYLPIFGWLWKLQEHIFLERNFDKDKRILEERINSILGGYDDPVTLVLFPEGTRFTEGKHKASMLVAKEKGLPELKYHLLPRTRGFETCVETIKNGNFNGLPVAVYDGLVVMEGGDLGKLNYSFTELLKGRGPKVRVLLRRYDVKYIDKEESGKWLHKRYQEKDRLMENYSKIGDFGEQFSFNKVLKLPRPLGVFGVISGLNLGIFFGGLWYVGGVLVNGNIFGIGVLVLVMIGASKAFQMMGDITKIKKGSAYGQDKGK